MPDIFANVIFLDRSHPLDRVPTPELRLAHARLVEAECDAGNDALKCQILRREELLANILRLRRREVSA